MKRFARLYEEIDSTTRTGEKVAALRRYFADAPPEDAVFALSVMTGRRIAKAVKNPLLAEWVGEAADVPGWMVGECYDSVGDWSETISLLVPWDDGPGCDWPLHTVVKEKLWPLAYMTPSEQKPVVLDVWRHCNRLERFLFHKLTSREFRVGAARTLVVRALAEVAGVDPAVMQHRVMGQWSPTAEDYRRLISGEPGEHEPGRPYPFYLAYQLNPVTPGEAGLGEPADWQVEWKWDGIRAQLIRRNGAVMVWSRGEELITDGFPELQSLGRLLPEGTVLDGEILAWEAGRPLPFGELQKRINRKRVEAMLFADVPIVFMAYDVLEWGGEDRRARPTRERRALLEGICNDDSSGGCGDGHLMLSPLVEVRRWEELDALGASARERGVEGFMLKRNDAPYGVGREKGAWWKWKVDPYSVDAVLLYAQRGNGKRAAIYSDYTFGVWAGDATSEDRGELVPFAKAYSGLTDEEINRVDRFVRANTIGRHGPVRVVKPELVFELHFEGLQASTRHRSGIAVRFPRMARWRTDKKAEDADSLETLRAMLTSHGAHHRRTGGGS